MGKPKRQGQRHTSAERREVLGRWANEDSYPPRIIKWPEGVPGRPPESPEPPEPPS